MGSIVVLTWIYQISWKGSTSFPHQSGFSTLTCFIISVLSNIINYQNFYYHSYANGTQTHHLKLNFCSFQPRINVKALSFQSTTRPVSKKSQEPWQRTVIWTHTNQNICRDLFLLLQLTPGWSPSNQTFPTSPECYKVAIQLFQVLPRHVASLLRFTGFLFLLEKGSKQVPGIQDSQWPSTVQHL